MNGVNIYAFIMWSGTLLLFFGFMGYKAYIQLKHIRRAVVDGARSKTEYYKLQQVIRWAELAAKDAAQSSLTRDNQERYLRVFLNDVCHKLIFHIDDSEMDKLINGVL